MKKSVKVNQHMFCFSSIEIWQVKHWSTSPVMTLYHLVLRRSLKKSVFLYSFVPNHRKTIHLILILLLNSIRPSYLTQKQMSTSFRLLVKEVYLEKNTMYASDPKHLTEISEFLSETPPHHLAYRLIIV